MTLGEDFHAILRAARLGEDWAWARLYRDIAPAVLGYLRAHAALDAEDLTGEVFLQVVRSLSTFEGDEAGFRSWVFTISHHRLLTDRRTHARRPTGPASDALQDRPAHDNTEMQVAEILANERIRQLIESLSEGQRDVLLLRILGGLTIEEVAQIIGKRTGAVKALQRRGLAALHKQLAVESVTEGVPL